MSENPVSRVRLSDAIAELRAEIERAKLEGEGKLVRFAAKEISVELSLEFGLTAEIKAGVSKWIPFVDISGKAGGSDKSVHKITLTLEIDPSVGTGGRIADSGGPKPVLPKS